MTNKNNSQTKKTLYILVVMSLLATITNCGCVSPNSPKITPDPNRVSNQNIFVFPENSITIKRFVDLNIMDTLRPGSNYTPDDVSITFSPVLIWLLPTPIT